MAGVLDAPAHSALLDAYNFARRLINALRMVRGNARDLRCRPQMARSLRFWRGAWVLAAASPSWLRSLRSTCKPCSK